MNYILIGLLVGFGWHISKLVYSVIEELLFVRLHKTKWYNILAGRKPQKIETEKDETYCRNKIGFH